MRDILVSHQFNPVVFDNLLKIANDIWCSDKKVSRLSILLKIKQYLNRDLEKGYYDTSQKPDRQLKSETRSLLFELFRKTYEEKKYISHKQLGDARRLCNNILLSLELTDNEVKWLCDNVHVSESIVNRVLRYPLQSNVISDWAKANFQTDMFRGRRAELLSWIIDKEPTFEVDKQTLVDDFEYLNKCDMLAIQNFEDELIANKIIEQDLGEFFPKVLNPRVSANFFRGGSIVISQPELKLPQRPYKAIFAESIDNDDNIPNFDKLREMFYENLPKHQKLTMIWAIAYSRLDNLKKSALLQKYYCDEIHDSVMKICRRRGNVEMLKWILEKQ